MNDNKGRVYGKQSLIPPSDNFNLHNAAIINFPTYKLPRMELMTSNRRQGKQ